MQTNALKFAPTETTEKGSRLYFPKAAFFKPTEKGFAMLPESRWAFYLEYEVLTNGTEAQP
jgi:hypothetical protein